MRSEKDKKENKDIEFTGDLETTPILYTDNINMIVNNYGVVLNITQRIKTGNQFRVIARIGMSREHAKKFVEKLTQLLIRTESKIVSRKKIVN